jgi:hypothetical protein
MSLRVTHWHDEGVATVMFFTEAQSQTKFDELVLAEKTDLHRHCSFLDAEHEGVDCTGGVAMVVFFTSMD